MTQKIEKKQQVCKSSLHTCKDWQVRGISLTLLSSLILLIIFWFTNIFRDSILGYLVLQKNSTAMKFWEHSPVNVVHHIYIFNYTNVDDFLNNRASKLRIQELGPYTYRETLMRVNSVIHDNGTITYQESRSYEWIGGNFENETVIVPNVPLLTSVAFSRNLNFIARFGMAAVFATLQQTPFIRLKSSEYLWGYEDKLFEITKGLLMDLNRKNIDKFGMLAAKKGVSNDRITIHTGNGDLENLGLIQNINGKEIRNIWNDKICDKVFGTDGSMFPPSWVRQKTTIYIYVKELCRRLSFRFQGYNVSSGIPTLRYKMSEDDFTSSSTKNSCFCLKTSGKETFCPPMGIYNSTICNYNIPVLISFPHFYLADEDLLTKIDGLNPKQELHESYLDVHQRLGVLVGGWSRLQLNVEVKTAVSVPILGNLKDGTILPLIWMETGLENIPESILYILYHAHFTASIVETSCKWGSPIIFLLSLFALLKILHKYRVQQPEALHRNTSGQNPLIE